VQDEIAADPERKHMMNHHPTVEFPVSV